MYDLNLLPMSRSKRRTDRHLVDARFGHLHELNPGKPSGRSKLKTSPSKSVPTCRGLRGSRTQRNRMKSPGENGGLRTSRAFREEGLVHEREGICCSIRQGHESEGFERPLVLS